MFNQKKIVTRCLVLIAISCFLITNTAFAAERLQIMSPKKVTLLEKETSKIKTNVTCKFKSSNKKIVTVDKKGKITAKNVGRAKITVISKRNKKQKKSITVIVKKAIKTEQVTTEQIRSQEEATELVTATESQKYPLPPAISIEAEKIEKSTEDLSNKAQITANYEGAKGVVGKPINIEKINVELSYNDGSKEKVDPKECDIYFYYENNDTPRSQFLVEDASCKEVGKNVFVLKYKNVKTTFEVEAIELDETSYCTFDVNNGQVIEHSSGEDVVLDENKIEYIISKKFYIYENNKSIGSFWRRYYVKSGKVGEEVYEYLICVQTSEIAE